MLLILFHTTKHLLIKLTTKKLAVDLSVIFYFFSIFAAYTTFFIMGLLMSMQVPFVGFQPIRTSEHMAAAGRVLSFLYDGNLNYGFNKCFCNLMHGIPFISEL